MINDIKQIPLFTEIPEDGIQEVSALLKEENYYPDGYIFVEGNPGDAFFIIQSGEVVISKIIDRKKDEHKTLAVLSKDDIFGEMALLDSRPRSASAVARTTVSVLRLSGSDFQKLLSAKPEVAINILFGLVRVLTSRLRQTDTELITVYETGKIVGLETEVQKMCKRILTQIKDVVKSASIGLIALWNEYLEKYEVQVSIGPGLLSSKEKVFRADEPIVKHLMENKEPLLVKDTKNDRRVPLLEKGKYYSGLSLLACPLVNSGKFLGFIILSSRIEGGTFTPHQVNMVSGICAQIAGAVQRVKNKGNFS